MQFSTFFSYLRPYIPLATIITFAATPAAAHEAWLLTPAEIEALVAAPVPPLFTSWLWLGLAAVLGAIVTGVALRAEEFLRPFEDRWTVPLAEHARSLGCLAVRLGLALMLLLAAFGGLPRHGTAAWTQPTFLVPDMQLSLFPGWGWLAAAQVVIGALLVLGLSSRLAGVAVVGLSGLGLVMAGPQFLAYAPHFAAPGLMLALFGAGAMSCDRWLGRDDAQINPLIGQVGWRLVQILVGGGFVYLAIAYKLTQPTLLIAILEHGSLPSFGLPMSVVALVMTGVEIICGALLIAGRMVRPVALVICGAITTLAIGLGETPLFHANLYGVMVFFALAGRQMPQPGPTIARLRSVMA